MSINKYDNNDSNHSSLLKRTLEYIRDTLAFRSQWMHLQKRGNTPNYNYLKSGEKARKHREKGLSDVSNINPCEAEELPVSEPVLNPTDVLFKTPPLTIEEHNSEEPIEIELHQVCDSGRHISEDVIVDPCPVLQEQIDTADAKNQLFIENVLPAGSIPSTINETILKQHYSSSGEHEVVTATYGSEEESVHQKESKETVSSQIKPHKNRGVQVRGQDRRDQMQLPFE